MNWRVRPSTGHLASAEWDLDVNGFAWRVFVKNDTFLHAVCQTGRRETHFPFVLPQTASNSNKQSQTVSSRRMCSRSLTLANSLKQFQTVSGRSNVKQSQTASKSFKQSQAVSNSFKQFRTGRCFHVFWLSKPL